MLTRTISVPGSIWATASEQFRNAVARFGIDQGEPLHKVLQEGSRAGTAGDPRRGSAAIRTCRYSPCGITRRPRAAGHRQFDVFQVGLLGGRWPPKIQHDGRIAAMRLLGLPDHDSAGPGRSPPMDPATAVAPARASVHKNRREPVVSLACCLQASIGELRSLAGFGVVQEIFPGKIRPGMRFGYMGYKFMHNSELTKIDLRD